MQSLQTDGLSSLIEERGTMAIEIYTLLPPILQNSVPCGADGLLGDAHDAAHGPVVHSHFIEEMEEKLSLAFKSQKDFIPLPPKSIGRWNKDSAITV